MFPGEEDLAPDEYERLTGISKEQYETRLLDSARYYLFDAPGTRYEHGHPPRKIYGALSDDGRIESVSLTGTGDSTEIVVLFRLNERPGHRFGWRMSIWPAPHPGDSVTGSPEAWASLFPIHIQEAVDSTPPQNLADPPDADGIEWLPRGP